LFVDVLFFSCGMVSSEYLYQIKKKKLCQEKLMSKKFLGALGLLLADLVMIKFVNVLSSEHVGLGNMPNPGILVQMLTRLKDD